MGHSEIYEKFRQHIIRLKGNDKSVEKVLKDIFSRHLSLQTNFDIISKNIDKHWDNNFEELLQYKDIHDLMLDVLSKIETVTKWKDFVSIMDLNPKIDFGRIMKKLSDPEPPKE